MNKVLVSARPEAAFRGGGPERTTWANSLSEAYQSSGGNEIAINPFERPSGAGLAGLSRWRIASPDDRDLVFQGPLGSCRARFARYAMASASC